MSSTSQVNTSIVGSSPTDTTLPVRMASKADLYGSIEPHGNNGRAALKIDGMYSKGPTRVAREEAVEDLRALNLARLRGLNAVAACAGALQANASAHRQARSASSTSQSDRIEEPSSQSTAVHASPLVGLDTCVCTGTQPSIAAPKIDEEFATAYYTPKKRLSLIHIS